MKFFFDRSVPIGLAKMVRAIDEKKFKIVHHDEDKRFSQQTTDIEWMRALTSDGEPRWIVISGDGRILRNKSEKQVLSETGMVFFCLDSPWVTWTIYESSWQFMKVWPEIAKEVASTKHKLFRIRGGSALKIEAI